MIGHHSHTWTWGNGGDVCSTKLGIEDERDGSMAGGGGWTIVGATTTPDINKGSFIWGFRLLRHKFFRLNDSLISLSCFGCSWGLVHDSSVSENNDDLINNVLGALLIFQPHKVSPCFFLGYFSWWTNTLLCIKCQPMWLHLNKIWVNLVCLSWGLKMDYRFWG